jgi:type II secretory ATPase GspE/PulE/Tfp pilus assembly ATPase PilB-like protein
VKLSPYKLEDGEHMIARIVNSLVQFAYRGGANGILLEPQPEAIAVFYQVKDKKLLQMNLPLYVYQPLVSHIKKLAGMNSDLEGTVRVQLEDKKNQLNLHYNLRVRILASPHGEQIVLRFEDEYGL